MNGAATVLLAAAAFFVNSVLFADDGTVVSEPEEIIRDFPRLNPAKFDRHLDYIMTGPACLVEEYQRCPGRKIGGIDVRWNGGKWKWDPPCLEQSDAAAPVAFALLDLGFTGIAEYSVGVWRITPVRSG